MQEAGRTVGSQDLELDESRGQARGGLEAQAGQGGSVAQLAAVSEHRQCLSQAQRIRVEAADSRRDMASDPFAYVLHWRLGRFDSAKQLRQVERVAATGPPERRAELGADL